MKNDPGADEPNIVSLAALQAWRASARPGATPEQVADIAAVAELLAEIGARALPDGSRGDTALRLARLSDHHGQLARLGELMAQIETDSAEASGYWRAIGSTHRDIAAQMRHAALLAADAEMT